MYESKKNSYTKEELLQDIKDLNIITHPYSIVVIKDTFNRFPSRYLLRYNQKWDCKMFFSFKTKPGDKDNEDSIISKLSESLQIEKSSISLEYKTEVIQKKYADHAKMEKIYDHKYYIATISKFTKTLKENNFSIGDEQYYWMSMNEMEKDERIQEKNNDVVSTVRNL